MNTYYVDTYDIALEKADKKFLAEHGKAKALRWIQKHAKRLAADHDMPSKVSQAGQIKSVCLQKKDRRNLMLYKTSASFAPSGVLVDESDVLADEEKVEEVYEDDEVANETDIGIDGEADCVMAGKVLDMKSLVEDGVLPTKDGKEVIGNENAVEVENDEDGRNKANTEMWDQFHIFRGMVKASINVIEDKEAVSDDDEEKNITRGKIKEGGEGFEGSKRTPIDPPTHDEHLLPDPKGTGGVYSLVLPSASSIKKDDLETSTL